jgi:hypothetical protein
MFSPITLLYDLNMPNWEGRRIGSEAPGKELTEECGCRV